MISSKLGPALRQHCWAVQQVLLTSSTWRPGVLTADKRANVKRSTSISDCTVTCFQCSRSARLPIDLRLAHSSISKWCSYEITRMLNCRKFLARPQHSTSWAHEVRRQCTCRAKRGRPRKTQVEEAPTFHELQEPVDTVYEPVPRRGRGRGRRSTAVEQVEEPLATAAEPAVCPSASAAAAST